MERQGASPKRPHGGYRGRLQRPRVQTGGVRAKGEEESKRGAALAAVRRVQTRTATRSELLSRHGSGCLKGRWRPERNQPMRAVCAAGQRAGARSALSNLITGSAIGSCQAAWTGQLCACRLRRQGRTGVACCCAFET